MIRTPIKGRGHITLDLCHPSATVVRHTVARAEIKSIPSLYTALRKTTWGGIFPAMQAPTPENVLSSTTVVTKNRKSWKRKPVHDHDKSRDIDDYNDDDDDFFDDEDEVEDEVEEVPIAKNVKFNKALNNQQMYIGRSARSQLTEIDRRTGSAIRREDRQTDRRVEKEEKKHASKQSNIVAKTNNNKVANKYDDDDNGDDDDGEDDSDDEMYYGESSSDSKSKRKGVIHRRGDSSRVIDPIRRNARDGKFAPTKTGPAPTGYSVTEYGKKGRSEKSHNDSKSSTESSNSDNYDDIGDEVDRPKKRGMPTRKSRRR